jgi:hypothetical protein
MNFEDILALREAFDAATQVLLEAFPHQELGRPMHNDWSKCQMYMQHVQRLAGLFVQISKVQNDTFHPSQDFVSLLATCGWYVYLFFQMSKFLPVSGTFLKSPMAQNASGSCTSPDRP